MATRRLLSTVAPAVLLIGCLGACGGTPSGSSASAASSSALPTPSATPAPTPTATPVPTPVPAAPAAAGNYPVHVVATDISGAQMTGNGTLVVAPPAADGTQADSVQQPAAGATFSLSLGFMPGGQVLLGKVEVSLASGQSTGCPPLALAFSPAIQLVPAALASGATWSGNAQAGALTGTYSGSATGEGEDTIGSTSVHVWRLHGTMVMKGMFCGAPLSVTMNLDSDWAPTLGLPVVSTLSFDARSGTFTGGGKLVSTLTATVPGG